MFTRLSVEGHHSDAHCPVAMLALLPRCNGEERGDECNSKCQFKIHSSVKHKE